MAVIQDQSKVNLKNLVRSLSGPEITTVAATFAKYAGVDISKTTKAISPKW